MTVSDFLIVTTFAPQSLDATSLRGKIFQKFLDQFDAIRGINYLVLLIGPPADIRIANSRIIASGLPSKETKLDFLRNYIVEQGIQARYITRLDDDDFLNVSLLNTLGNSNDDFITDSQHTFFDISSGLVSRQVRPWFPNTTLIKFEHALCEPWEKGKSLLFHYDHSQAWHRYAAERRLQVHYPEQPVYLRILSPFSITSSGNRSGMESTQAWNKLSYLKYLARFGTFKTSKSPVFGRLTDDLKKYWCDHQGQVRKHSTLLEFYFHMHFIAQALNSRFRWVGII